MTWLALLLLAVAGCAGAPPPVQLAESWPSRAPRYSDAYERWTRHDSASHELVQAIDAYATLESAEWRAAYLAEQARREQLPADEVARRAEFARGQSAQVWQLELVVATADLDWNDFARLSRSMWRVSLVAADGREVLPMSIVQDRRERADLEFWFPGLGPFHRAYLVTFPKATADGKPLIVDGEPRLALKIASTLARVEMTWSAR